VYTKRRLPFLLQQDVRSVISLFPMVKVIDGACKNTSEFSVCYSSSGSTSRSHLLIFLTAVLSAWKSGRSAASSAQQRRMRFTTSSSHVRSSTDGRKLTFCPFFTFSTISAKKIQSFNMRKWNASCFRKPFLLRHVCVRIPYNTQLLHTDC